MTVSIPLVVIAGAFIWIAYRYMGLRIWQAIVCLIFGFLLAATHRRPGNPKHPYRTRPVAYQAMTFGADA